MTTKTLHCDGCGERLAELRRDEELSVTTFPGILYRRVREAFAPHGEWHVQFQLDHIDRHRDDVVDPEALYVLECGRCVRRDALTGSTLIRYWNGRNLKPKIHLREPGHLEPIPDSRFPDSPLG